MTNPCGCAKCLNASGETVEMFAGIRIPVADTMMVLCAICGNKRCPHATNHELACTNSNAPGQPGSSYEHCKPSVVLPKPSVAVQLTDPACEDIVTQFQKDCAAVTQALKTTCPPGDDGPMYAGLIVNPLTTIKTQDIVEHSDCKVGYVLLNAGGEVCLSAQGAVRWLDQPQYLRLMTEKPETRLTEFEEIARLTHDLAHWKANHAHLVNRCAFLSERPDLPVDRIPAFTRMTNELSRLKQELAIKDAALIAAGVNLADIIDAPQELKLEFSAVLPVDLCTLQITAEPPTEINPVPGA